MDFVCLYESDPFCQVDSGDERGEINCRIECRQEPPPTVHTGYLHTLEWRLAHRALVVTRLKGQSPKYVFIKKERALFIRVYPGKNFLFSKKLSKIEQKSRTALRELCAVVDSAQSDSVLSRTVLSLTLCCCRQHSV